METLQDTATVKEKLLSYFEKERINIAKILRLYIDDKAVQTTLSSGAKHFLKRISLLKYQSEQERKSYLLDMALALEDRRIPVIILRTKLHFFLYWHRTIWKLNKELKKSHIQSKQQTPTGFYIKLNIFLDKAEVLPQNVEVWHFILKTLSEQQPKLLAMLMKKIGLNNLTSRQLRTAERLTTNQLIGFAHFIRLSQKEDEEFIRLGFVFITDGILEEQRAFQSARLLYTFLAEVFPQLMTKVKQVIPAKQFYFSKKIRAPWLNIWAGYSNPNGLGSSNMAYQNRFAELAEEVLTFNQMIQYVPAYIWWHLGSEFFKAPMVEHLGAGKNIRTFQHYHLMSNRMAHVFTNLEPTECQPQQMMSYAFLRSLDLNKTLAGMMVSYLPSGLLLEADFEVLNSWKPIVLKLVLWQDSELTEHQWMGVMAYIRHCLDEYEAWSIKGRTLFSICRQTQLWQEMNSRIAASRQVLYWNRAKQEEWNRFQDGKWYAIVQLLNTYQLVEESRRLSHCVQGYDRDCVRGDCSIWSLRVYVEVEIEIEGKKVKKKEWQSLVTIELSNEGEIEQMKASHNTQPEDKWMEMIGDWAKPEGLKVVKW